MVSPANKLRNNYLIVTSKRRFDVIITHSLNNIFAGSPLFGVNNWWLSFIDKTLTSKICNTNSIKVSYVFIKENKLQIFVGKAPTMWVQGDVGVVLKVHFIFIPQNIRSGTHCDIAFRWMPQDIADEQATQVQWFRWQRGTVMQQAVTWANIDSDMCLRIMPIGPNELITISNATNATLIPAWTCNHCSVNCGMKFLFHSQTSTVQPLNFGNG